MQCENFILFVKDAPGIKDSLNLEANYHQKMHLDRLKDAVYLPINCKQKMHLEAKSYSLLAMEIALNVLHV